MQNQKILIGFMGSGKSTVGKYLSYNYKMEWVDLDTYIQKHTKLSIPDIFKTYGENYFRDKEHAMLEEVLKDQKISLISTGGGIVERQANIDLLKQRQCIYLKWAFDTLYERIIEDPNRPLAKTYNQLKELYRSREKAYEETASKIVNCENKSINQVVEEILG